MSNGEQVDPALLEEETAGEPDDEVEVVVRLDAGPPPPGLRIVSRLGPVATGRVRRDELLRVHEDEAVHSLKAARSFGPPGSPAEELAAEPDSPDSEAEIQPDDLRPRHPRDDPARGVGSVAAFCDWGPDIIHPDGRWPDGGTRFLAIWDQRGRRGSAPGAGANRFGYGRIHDQDAINRALAGPDPYGTLGLHPGDADRDGNGSHGMHTLSIAAGTPGEGRPGGVAPGAGLVFVNLADHARGEGANLGNSATLLEAFDFCQEVAGGRPLVCNFSMGRTADAHRGLSLLERAFDALLLGHDGLAVINSAGNYHRARLHAASRLTPGGRYDAGWELDPTRGGPHVLEVWYPWRDTLRFQLRAPDGSLVADVPLGQRAEVHRDGRLWARAYHRYLDPNVPLNQVAVYAYAPAPAGTWVVSLLGEDVVDGQCDLWIDRTGLPGAQSRFRAEDAVATSTTGSICNGFHSITVGAFDLHDPDADLGSFSSGGPTGDGRMVPHLVAPGVREVAARSAPLEPEVQPSLVVAKSGTSEAAPHVAGLVACMYEVAGPLPIRQVRRLLLQNTEPPPAASRGEAYRWGLGYVDVERVLAATREAAAQDPQRPGRTAALSTLVPSAAASAMPVHQENMRRRSPMAVEPSPPPPAPEAIDVREAQADPTTYYGRQPDLLAARLAPTQPITIEPSWPSERRELARTYNRLGGLLTVLATRARLEVPAILAVWQVESGGAPHVPGRAIIRFENHLLWRSWGQHDPERFDASFQFGGRAPMTDPDRCGAPFRCHRYRPAATSTDPNPAWRPVHPAHGGQDDEYAALQLARNLAGDEAALTSISIGGPQILVTNHRRLGYESAREMYDAFQGSEAAQVLGFVDFCEHDGAGGNTLQRLRDHDWSGFARRYNGSGQVATYARRLEAAYAEASQLFRPERTPATERLEPDVEDVPERTVPWQSEVAEAIPRRGRDLPDPALTTAVLAVGLSRLFSGRDVVVSGQPLDLGEGRSVEVLAAPRGYLTAPPAAGDLLVRKVAGEQPIVTVLESGWLQDAGTAASAAIPSESILPGQYAPVLHDGSPRLRRLVDAEGRMPTGQALVRLPTEAWPGWSVGDGESDLEAVPVGDGGEAPVTESDVEAESSPDTGALAARVTELIASGVRDENKLTDTIFQVAHPEVGTRGLRPDDQRDQTLIQEWLGIRDQLVRPALRRTTSERPAATERPPTEPAVPATVDVSAERFVSEHRDVLRRFPWRDDTEMRLLIGAIANGFRERLFEADNIYSGRRLERLKLPVTATSGLPLIHTVFMNRHPGRVLTGQLYDSYRRADGVWDLRQRREQNPLLINDDWNELDGIGELVFQVVRFTLPRITPRPVVSERSSLGEKVAARAHCYLGVRYALGAWRYEPNPEHTRPRPDTLDCTAVLRDGRGTLDCSALVNYAYWDILGRHLKWQRGCPQGVMCLYEGGDFDDIGSPAGADGRATPRAGDLLIAGKPGAWHHVGLFVGVDQLIDSWYTGTFVRKRSYIPKDWQRILRFNGEG